MLFSAPFTNFLILTPTPPAHDTHKLRRRMAAWVVAIGAVAAYNYYDSQKTGDFTKEEQDAWNKQKKEATASK